MSTHGKWSERGVPHKGWHCVGVEDLGAVQQTCEMCETQDIRYVHYMQHSDYVEELGVGCVCTEKMEEDYEAPRRRELRLRAAAGRRRRWLRRKWMISERGNPYLNTDGLNITVFAHGDGTWGGRIEERSPKRSISSRRRYKTCNDAKLAAFDAMIFLKARGWGT